MDGKRAGQAIPAMKKNELELWIEVDKLPNYGENTARLLAPKGRGAAKTEARALRRAEEELEALCKGEALAGTAALEWLRDNRYVLRRDAAGAGAALRGEKKLRRLEDGAALLCRSAEAIVRSGAGKADPTRVKAFLTGFQRVLPLEERELCLLPDALRCALILWLRAHPEAAETVFASLKWLSDGLLSPLLEACSTVDRLLRQDPSGVYPRMDEESRQEYRRETAVLAKKQGLSEEETARRALELARREGGHVGEYLFRRPLGKPEKKRPYGPYLALHLLLPLALALALGFCTGSLWPVLLGVFPLHDAVKFLFDRICTKCLPPRRLPRLDYSGGIPAESRTLAVSAVLLTDARSAGEAVKKLETFRLANRDAGENLLFGLLADLKEGPNPRDPADEGVLAAARREIDRLNEAYGGGFCLLARERSYSARDRLWRAGERKRGAVMALTALLRGEESPLQIKAGDRSALRAIRFLIVLDGDTMLNLGSAARLAGTLAHPLQAPLPDRERRRVRAGYGLLQPRISVSLRDAERSDFSRIFAGQGGLDPYGSVTSDVYQDLFREGSFAGKGILDVDTFYAVLHGRIPPETLLSHDLIEGSYVGCAFLSDVELTDGFPASLLSYFERQHRWVRGDWQTLPWLFPRVRNEAGEREPNPLTPLAKWKILDNLCRSLTPLAEFLTVLFWGFVPGRAGLWTLGTVLGCLALRVIVNSTGELGKHTRRYRARFLSAAGGDFLQLLWLLLLLPYRAWVQLSAVSLALYRSLVSRRNMLAWVTASEGDRRNMGNVLLYVRRMWFSFPAALLGLLSPQIPLRALGLLWLLAPLLGWAASRPGKDRAAPSEEERLFLLHCAGDILRYYEELVTPERHFLPPDNLQELPVRETAERTSPTNVGLYLLSCLAAADLGFWPKERSWRRISDTLATLRQLPRFRGHLYNWYDIRTAQPLEPAFISTVDSGNLLACLKVLEAAAEEAEETEALEALRTLSEEMRLDFLYDRDKELMRIGWDPREDKPAGGWYDLMESEARITSFLAVARGEAPPRHWRRLGRVLADGAGMSGMASWTGTMFEYLMPALFMPSPRGSLLAESTEFCLHLQRRCAPGGVWGMSESAFYEMDAAEHYAYKAHGVQGLALKQGMDRERVVAPYAAFLALPAERRAVLRNLRRLRALGAEGQYGFYEALDFTEERRGEQPFRVVRCFMAHHLGMSLLAIDNCLEKGILQKRFLSIPEHRACLELLEEKTPVGQRIRPLRSYRAAPRPERSRAEGFLLRTEGYDPELPSFRPLCGESYCLVQSDLGDHSARCVLPGKAGEAAEVQPHGGVSLFVGLEGGLLSLQPRPEQGDPSAYDCSWDGKSLTRYFRSGELECRVRSFVPERPAGEVRQVTLVNGSRKRELTLVFYLEPILCPERDYAAHPAFQRLCTEVSMEAGVLTFSHRPGGKLPPASLSIAASQPFSAETDKALALGRGGLRALAGALRREGSGVRASSEPCALLRIPLRLRAGETRTVTFALATSSAKEESAAAARKLLRLREPESGRFARALGLLGELLTPAEALSLLPPLLLGSAARTGAEGDRSALWRFGVSGDLPTAAAEAGEGERMLTAWAFLHTLGIPFDLLLHTGDEGVYGRPETEALRSLTAGFGLGGWENRPGGFRFIGGSPEERQALWKAVDASGLSPGKRHAPAAGHREAWFLPAETLTAGERSVRFTEEGCLAVTASGVGRRAWSLLLTGGRLGWIASDSGSGHLWLDNARERPLTPWKNDPLALEGPEELCLCREGRSFSLLAGADEAPTEILYGFGWIRWRRQLGETETEVTGFIPWGEERRILLLRLRNAREKDTLRHRLQPSPGRTVRSRAWGEGREQRALSETAPSGEEILSVAAGEALCLVTGPGTPLETTVPEAERLLEETRRHWRETVEALRVKTPSRRLNDYLNGWALYQTLACRVLGRASLYQNGGAYGFRDQLQDVCALMDFFPALAREHLLRAAAHQYEEGDVMHWWHPGVERDKGVRTRCSDDLLWLPYACALYVEKTGDASLWEEKAPWLRSLPLMQGEKDRYETPETAGEGTVLEHCRRALRQTEERGCGPHGLLRFGAGDWNDGMDRVGGESVWLTWFAALVFERLGQSLGDPALRKKAAAFGRAAEGSWRDGQYLRGYYADGRPLGAAGDRECSLDSLAQSFAVLSGFGDPDHARAAVQKAADLLLDREHGLVKLFTPPFDGRNDPGYIRSYLPGVRENGGQYTHGAIWLAAACLRCGETERGWELLENLLPSGRLEESYQTEPFVLAADVYAHPDMAGRGGWTWYTGAAGWFLRTAVEELLGVRTRAGVPEAAPRLPAGWSGCEVRCRAGGTDYTIRICREGETWRTEKVKAE